MNINTKVHLIFFSINKIKFQPRTWSIKKICITNDIIVFIIKYEDSYNCTNVLKTAISSNSIFIYTKTR